jgi:hypothetical protein
VVVRSRGIGRRGIYSRSSIHLLGYYGYSSHKGLSGALAIPDIQEALCRDTAGSRCRWWWSVDSSSSLALREAMTA